MKRLRGILAVCGTACVYCAMGMYFSSGNTAVYLASYLRKYSGSNVELSDNMWFLAAVGLSAVILPIGGWLDSIVGVRLVCVLAGLLQSFGIFATYFALETNFFSVVLCYGGSFFLSCGVAYTAPLANINKWFPEKRGLVTGIVAASMAITPSVWTPVVTAYVNPNNIAPDEHGYFNDYYVLERTKQSLLLQGSVSLALFLVGVTLIFPAPSVSELNKEQGPINELPSYVSKKEIFLSSNTFLRNEDGLTPTQAIKTKVFFLLSLKIMLTEMVFFYLLFVYKPFGQTFISDDFVLSAIGSCAAVGNALCRLLAGHLKDMITYKKCCAPLSGTATVLVATLALTTGVHPFVYAVWIVISVSITGSQYALMPSAVTEYFGERYASINIGLVYMSTVVANILGAVGSQLLTQYIGWKGMIAVIAFCSLIDFVSTFFLPNDPKCLLKEQLLNLQYNYEMQKDNTTNFYHVNYPVTFEPVSRRSSGPNSVGNVTVTCCKHEDCLVTRM